MSPSGPHSLNPLASSPAQRSDQSSRCIVLHVLLLMNTEWSNSHSQSIRLVREGDLSREFLQGSRRTNSKNHTVQPGRS